MNIVGNWEHTTFNCFDLNGYQTNCRKRRRGSEGNPKAPATVAGKEQQDLIFAQQPYQNLLTTLFFGSLHLQVLQDLYIEGWQPQASCSILLSFPNNLNMRLIFGVVADLGWAPFSWTFKIVFKDLSYG